MSHPADKFLYQPDGLLQEAKPLSRLPGGQSGPHCPDLFRDVPPHGPETGIPSLRVSVNVKPLRSGIADDDQAQLDATAHRGVEFDEITPVIVL